MRLEKEFGRDFAKKQDLAGNPPFWGSSWVVNSKGSYCHSAAVETTVGVDAMSAGSACLDLTVYLPWPIGSSGCQMRNI